MRVIKHLAGCLGGWWHTLCWRYSKLVWAMHWATSPNCLCFERWFGQKTYQSPSQHIGIYDLCPTSVCGLSKYKEKTIKKMTHCYVKFCKCLYFMSKFQLSAVAFGNSCITVPFKVKINYSFISKFIGMLYNHLPVYGLVIPMCLYYVRPLCYWFLYLAVKYLNRTMY